MRSKLILLAILLLALVLRWYKIDNPIADWHSWRQADTASVSQNYVRKGIDLLHPTYHDLSSVPTESPFDNLEGYRFVEFPHGNALHALLAKNFTFWNIDMWGRALSVFYSLGSIYLIYLITRRLSGESVGLLSSFFMAVLPFSVYYSRVVLPEPLAILLFLSAAHFLLRNLQTGSKFDFALSSVSFAFGMMTKPYLIFFTLPFFYWAIREKGSKILKSGYFYLYILIALLPFGAWRIWMTQFPEGIPASSWLYNLDGLRLRPAWWRWLFAERLGGLILGYWGILPLSLGLIVRPSKKEGFTYLLWALGVFTYFAVFAGGNVTHDYYQSIIVPFIAVFLAKGTDYLIKPSKALVWPLTIAFSAFCVGMMLFLSWYQIRGYYNINHWAIVHAGKAADALLPEEAKVIAPYSGDTALLYQTRRDGWPLVTDAIFTLMDRGATHYVSVNFDDQTNQLINKPSNVILDKTDDYVIIELHK